MLLIALYIALLIDLLYIALLIALYLALLITGALQGAQKELVKFARPRALLGVSIDGFIRESKLCRSRY